MHNFPPENFQVFILPDGQLASNLDYVLHEW